MYVYLGVEDGVSFESRHFFIRQHTSAYVSIRQHTASTPRYTYMSFESRYFVFKFFVMSTAGRNAAPVVAVN